MTFIKYPAKGVDFTKKGYKGIFTVCNHCGMTDKISQYTIETAEYAICRYCKMPKSLALYKKGNPKCSNS